MPTCKKCGDEFPNWVTIDDKKRNLQNRKYCLDCSPFGEHNTRPIVNEILYCEHCGKKLTGNQRKYCSTTCKFSVLQSYETQQERGYIRKLQLVEMAGGECSVCSYNKNLAVLSFHHLDPKKKKFQLTLRSLSNRTWAACLKEFKKCILVCANCHLELHRRDMGLAKLKDKYGEKVEEIE